MNDPHHVEKGCLAACPSTDSPLVIRDSDYCKFLLPVALPYGPSPFPHPLNGREQLVVLVTEDF